MMTRFDILSRPKPVPVGFIEDRSVVSYVSRGNQTSFLVNSLENFDFLYSAVYFGACRSKQNRLQCNIARFEFDNVLDQFWQRFYYFNTIYNKRFVNVSIAFFDLDWELRIEGQSVRLWSQSYHVETSTKENWQHAGEYFARIWNSIHDCGLP